MTCTEMAALMREAIFAQHNVALTPTLAVRHRFGIRLIRALCACLAISEHSAQHAMLLWTLSVSMSAMWSESPKGSCSDFGSGSSSATASLG